jgi:cob(I)alamin adenosyltransferase
MMPRIDEVLVPVQRDLFAIGALLATPDREKMREQLAKARVDEERIAELEHAIDECEAELEPLRSFILPGGTPKASALHVARTVCRRAERRVVALQQVEELPELVVIYMNRLSDLLFMLARVANRRAGRARSPGEGRAGWDRPGRRVLRRGTERSLLARRPHPARPRPSRSARPWPARRGRGTAPLPGWTAPGALDAVAASRPPQPRRTAGR